MAGIKKSTFLDPRVDAAIEAIAQHRKWSASQTIAELLRECPALIAQLRKNGVDPETLEPVTDAPAS